MRTSSLFVWAGLTGLLFVGGAGCRDTTGSTGNPDLSVKPADLSGVQPGADLSGVQPGADLATGTPETISDLYKMGVKSAPYTIQNAVVTGITRSLGPSKSKGICQYEAYVQDKDGTTAPNGIRLYAKGSNCVTPDGGTRCDCPFPPNSGTPLDALANASNMGDVYTVTGTWDIFSPAVDGGTLPAQHELVVVTMTMTGTGGAVTPAAVDPSKFAVNGQGFIDYENTLVEIKPASKGTIANMDQYYAFDFGGAHFIAPYRFLWPKVDGGYFVQNGNQYTSIVGIATLPFGGGVAARTDADFTP